MFCICGIETRFLHLILIFLLPGFHRNTSKSQTFSILNCYARKTAFCKISVTIEKKLWWEICDLTNNVSDLGKNFNFSKNFKVQRKHLPLYIFPFQMYPLYEMQQTDKQINTVGAKHFQRNAIHIYLQQRHSNMILTTYAVNTNHHLGISHVQTSQQFGIRTDIVCMKCRVLPTS